MFPKRVFGNQNGNKSGNIPIYSGLPISKTDTDLKIKFHPKALWISISFEFYLQLSQVYAWTPLRNSHSTKDEN